MSDLYIFGMGCFVSVICASAVGLLLWGAANEPRASAPPSKKASEVAPRSGPTPPVPVTTPIQESKSPA